MGPEITKLMEKGMVNTPSKLAYFELTKRQKATQYKEKKSQNPLDEFKGFDSRKLGQIFQRWYRICHLFQIVLESNNFIKISR